MNTTTSNHPQTKTWHKSSECNVDDLKKICSVQTNHKDYPHAVEIAKNIPIYDADLLDLDRCNQEKRSAIMMEWIECFKSGPGVIIIKNMMSREISDKANKCFLDLLKKEKDAGWTVGDHFGTNSRLWNSLEKMAVHDPKLFVQYYANEVLDTVSEAWLGPKYQMTAQVNLVHPGGKPQCAHVDYHLGHMKVSNSQRYPAHMHEMCGMLTLQGAIAHCDWPLESGPTYLLPHSQKYDLRYLCFHQKEFQEFFDEHYVHLEMKSGDGVFFNPSIIHAAGENKTQDIQRMANLFQVNAAFGRAMEAINRKNMCLSIYQELIDAKNSGLTNKEIDNVIANTAEAYSFPSNLDLDHPSSDDVAPRTQASYLLQAVREEWPIEKFEEELTNLEKRRTP